MNQNGTSVAVAVENHKGKVDLATSYMGLDLVSPVIIGSCPLNIDFEATRRMVEAGIGAIVLPSILKEQLIHRLLIQSDPISANEQSGHAPQQDRYNRGPQEYLKTIQRMKNEYDIPIIASMHGATIGSWLDYAVEIQESGADALELNWQIVETNTRDLHIPLAASGGVRTGDDVIKTMIAGADVAIIVTLQRVRSHITRVCGERKGARPARDQPEQPHGMVRTETLDATRCVSLCLAGHPYDLRGSRIPRRWMVSR